MRSSLVGLLRDAVPYTAAKLDAYDPEWYQKINPDELIMDDSCQCVIGQLGLWWDEWDDVFPYSPKEHYDELGLTDEAHHPHLATLRQGDFHTNELLVHEADTLWRNEIQQRGG